MAAYGLLDRLLHRLALGSTSIANLSFDLDQSLIKADVATVAAERHVFVSGLARAGTTVLMRGFHETGAFRSLTYRDMPFVLAPNLWRRISATSARQSAAVERAHGDGVTVDVDSPESLDEVFWRVFAGDGYIRRNCLVPHEPDDDTLSKFVRYVGAILAAPDGTATRYLSKNNNNVLRLPHIRRAFPNALILIPFRDPNEQARSLLEQHRLFARVQADDAFAYAYMRWLAHHEFGLGHRPFRFDNGLEPGADASIRDLPGYWLGLWCKVYEWLERTSPDGAIFVDYEALCTDPCVWARLAELAGVPGDDRTAPAFRSGNKGVPESADPALAERAAALHGRLVKRARNALMGPAIPQPTARPV